MPLLLKCSIEPSAAKDRLYFGSSIQHALTFLSFRHPCIDHDGDAGSYTSEYTDHYQRTYPRHSICIHDAYADPEYDKLSYDDKDGQQPWKRYNQEHDENRNE